MTTHETVGRDDAQLGQRDDARGSDGATTATARVKRRLLRATRDEGLRSAAFAFVLTRLIVLVILVVGGQMNRVSEGNLQTTRELQLSLAKIPLARILRDTIVHADVNWYIGIAEQGYEKIPFNADSAHNWAFFPLFPLAWRAVAQLTGEYVFAGLALAHLCFFFALLLFYRTAREFGLDAAQADRAVFYLAAFPVSYFFSLPLTESLFLLLTVGSFYSAKRGRWRVAALLGALASATRVTGVLLLPALAVLYFQQHGRASVRRAEALWLLLVPAGLVSFMLYLYAITGNAFAFRDILAVWGRTPGIFLAPLVKYLREPLLIASPWDFRAVNFAAATLALACSVVLLRRREWALGTYAMISTFVALSSQLLQSQARYAMVLFPVFMVLARLAGVRPRLDQTIRAVSLVLLALLTALFAARFTIAMS